MSKKNMELYQMWAPPAHAVAGSTSWTDWAKPVLFASLPSTFKGDASELLVKQPAFMPEGKSMIIVDLPSVQGVEEALGFAREGFRPVPLYNGVMSNGKVLVDVKPLGRALYSGAEILRTMTLPNDAPPVFMLDANRMEGAQKPLSFDNRWCVFPQDMPSARYLKSHGIEKVILRAEKLQTDLSRVLYDYKKNGIALYICTEKDRYPRELAVKKRSFWDEFAYRFKTIMGLKRNAAGGFGGNVPAASESGGGYYRMG